MMSQVTAPVGDVQGGIIRKTSFAMHSISVHRAKATLNQRYTPSTKFVSTNSRRTNPILKMPIARGSAMHLTIR